MLLIYMYSVWAEWLAMCSNQVVACMYKRQACFDKQCVHELALTR